MGSPRAGCFGFAPDATLIAACAKDGVELSPSSDLLVGGIGVWILSESEVPTHHRIANQQRKLSHIPVLVLRPEGGAAEVPQVDSVAVDFIGAPIHASELALRVKRLVQLGQSLSALERKERDLSLVLELTQALASNLEFSGIMFTAVQRIADVVKVDRASVVLVQPHGQTGYVVATSDDAALQNLPISLTNYPEIRQALETRVPLILSDARPHALLDSLKSGGRPAAFSALAIVPIVFGDRAMGVLFLRAKQAFAFGAHELRLCQTVAGAVAIALRNARVLQSLRDQTEEVTVARVEAERRMRSLQRFADYFESAAEGIAVFGLEGQILFANPQAREITGYNIDEARRLGLNMLVAESPDRIERLIEGFNAARFPRDVDFRMLRKDGKVITLSVNFSSVLRTDGVVLCTFRDVTEQRELEAELVKTKAFLERVVDASIDGVVSIDNTGAIVSFNRAAERLVGRRTDEVVGRHMRTIYPEGVGDDVLGQLSVENGRLEAVRFEVLGRSGERIPVLLSAAKLQEHGTAVGFVSVLTDLRERLRMEQDLASAQEQLLAREREAVLAEVAGATAHELNQPLTSIMGYAEILRREGGGHSSRAAEVIAREAERMAEIVRKIGKLTKYETKSYVGRARILDLDRASVEPAPPPTLPEQK